MSYNPWVDIGTRHPDVHVERMHMRPARGAWVPSQRVILLDRHLRRAERNAVLAHEIAHIDLEHVMTGRKWFDRRQERQADELAAERLVDIGRLAEVLRWALCPEEVAHELEVPVDVVRRRIRSLTADEKASIEQRLAA